MADATTYYDGLSDEDSAAVEQVITPEALAALGTGAGSNQEKIAAKRVDRVIGGAPALTSPVVIYRSYSGAEEIRNGGIIADRAFLTGVTTDPGNSGSVTLSITIPAGTKALQIPGDSGSDAYILARNTPLAVEPAKTGLVPAIVGDSKGFSLTASAPVVGMTILNQPNQEFYNHAHGKGGKFTSGGGSRGVGSGVRAPKNNDGSKRKLTPAQKKNLRYNRTTTVIGAVAKVLAVVGIAAYLINVNQATKTSRSGVRPQARSTSKSPRSFYSRDFHKRTTSGPLPDANKRNESASEWYERTLREKPVIR